MAQNPQFQDQGMDALRGRAFALREGDDLLGERTQLLRLRQGGLDALFTEERGREIAEQGDPVGGDAAQLPSDSVTDAASRAAL